MTTSDGERFAEGRYRSRELGADFPGQMELLSRSHRSFCARAAQELHRAERYRQYLSLVIVHGDRAEVGEPNDPYQDMHGPLADLCAAVRADCRVSDIVSGVEGGKFVILLVEAGSEGAQRFRRRLEETIRAVFCGRSPRESGPVIPMETITFPEQQSSHMTLFEALDALYRRSNTRPHVS